MTKHRAAILLLALVAASALALGARADSGVPEGKVAVLGQLDGFSDGGDIRDGLIPVFVEPAGDDFLDGRDIPEGLVPVFAEPVLDGFSDGGDIAVWVLPAPAGFSDGDDVPEELVAVYAQLVPDGFSDGGDRPAGMVAVLMEPVSLSQRSFSPGG